MKDDFINQFDQPKPPRPEFTAALYQRISHGTGGSAAMKTTSRKPIWRFFALALSAVAMITAVLFFSPSTRALADSLIRQIGGYVFIQAAPTPEPAQKDLSAQEDVASSPEQKATLDAYKQQLKEQMKKQEQASKKADATFAADAAAASQLTGFTVLAPAYVPDGFAVGSVRNVTGGWAVLNDWGSVAAIMGYENPTTNGFMVIEALQYQADEPRTIERPAIQDVTVRGLPGVWMPDNGGKSLLVWEENNIMYTIATNTLPLDELLKVAESLGK